MKKQNIKIKKVPSKVNILSTKYSKADDHTLIKTSKVSAEYIAKLENFDGLGKFYFITPDPIDILVKYIESSISIVNSLKKEFKNKIKKPAHKLNPEEEVIIDKLILNAVALPVMIYCVLETFVNQKIFDSYIIDSKCSFEVQRYVPLEKKLFKILPEITFKKDFFDTNSIKSSYKKINKIRNNIIHQKTITKERGETRELVKELLCSDWNLIMADIKKIIYEL